MFSWVLRGSFEGKLSAEPLVAARCLFVCLNPFYSALSTPRRRLLRGSVCTVVPFQKS